MLYVAIILTLLMLTVIFTDLTRYIIPNWLVAILLALYPVLVLLAPTRPDWKMGILAALCMFVAGFLLFVSRVMGGGDVKLLTAASLYTGFLAMPEFMMGVGILGGFLALALLALRPLAMYGCSKMQSSPRLPRVLLQGEPVPYGIAIAISFLVLLWKNLIPGIILH